VPAGLLPYRQLVLLAVEEANHGVREEKSAPMVTPGRLAPGVNGFQHGTRFSSRSCPPLSPGRAPVPGETQKEQQFQVVVAAIPCLNTCNLSDTA